MAVLAVLLTVLLSMVNGASALWRESEKKVDSFREGRAALNLIASDLATIHSSINPTYISVATTNAEIQTLVRTPAKAEIGNALFFLTSLPSSAQDPSANRGDLCAVGYFVSFAKASASVTAKNSYNLYRYFISSDETFENIIGKEPTPFFKGAGPKVSAATNKVEIVARNITQFQISAYSIAQSPDGSFNKLEPYDQTASDSPPMPDVLDITLVAVNQDVADRWDGNRAEWENTESITHVQNARTFNSRVYLNTSKNANAGPSPSPSPTP